MTLDEDLLRAGRGALARLHEAHLRVDAATADFHHAIRRLNIAGASRREIAAAFDLSHQRVDQIVVGSGGRFSDWSFRAAPVTSCSFCAGGTASLVHGPGVAICAGCVERLTGDDELWHVRDARCSFCGKRAPPDVTTLHSGPEAIVCVQCLRLAHQIQCRVD